MALGRDLFLGPGFLNSPRGGLLWAWGNPRVFSNPPLGLGKNLGVFHLWKAPKNGVLGQRGFKASRNAGWHSGIFGTPRNMKGEALSEAHMEQGGP